MAGGGGGEAGPPRLPRWPGCHQCGILQASPPIICDQWAHLDAPEASRGEVCEENAGGFTGVCLVRSWGRVQRIAAADDTRWPPRSGRLHEAVEGWDGAVRVCAAARTIQRAEGPGMTNEARAGCREPTCSDSSDAQAGRGASARGVLVAFAASLMCPPARQPQPASCLSHCHHLWLHCSRWPRLPLQGTLQASPLCLLEPWPRSPCLPGTCLRCTGLWEGGLTTAASLRSAAPLGLAVAAAPNTPPLPCPLWHRGG